MTCIIAIAQAGDVWMGADRGCWKHDGNLAISMPNSKLIRRGELIFGSTGTTASMKVLRIMDIPSRRADISDMEYLDGSLTEAYFVASNKYRAIRKYDGEDLADNVLFAYRGNIHEITGEGALISLGEYHAIGGGAEVAYGVLWATRGQLPRERILSALRGALEHTGAVRAPFDVECLGSAPAVPAPPQYPLDRTTMNRE